MIHQIVFDTLALGSIDLPANCTEEEFVLQGRLAMEDCLPRLLRHRTMDVRDAIICLTKVMAKPIAHDRREQFRTALHMAWITHHQVRERLKALTDKEDMTKVQQCWLPYQEAA